LVIVRRDNQKQDILYHMWYDTTTIYDSNA
jgi:hypothetical protein